MKKISKSGVGLLALGVTGIGFSAYSLASVYQRFQSLNEHLALIERDYSLPLNERRVHYRNTRMEVYDCFEPLGFSIGVGLISGALASAGLLATREQYRR